MLAQSQHLPFNIAELPNPGQYSGWEKLSSAGSGPSKQRLTHCSPALEPADSEDLGWKTLVASEPPKGAKEKVIKFPLNGNIVVPRYLSLIRLVRGE